MSTRPGENDFALGPIRGGIAFVQDAWRDDPSCDRLLLELGAVAQHAREVARDTMEGDRTSSFYTDDEEDFVSLVNRAVEDLNEEIEDRGCVGTLPGTVESQLDVFNSGWEAGSAPLATGGLDNIAKWAEQNMTEEQQQEMDDIRQRTEDVRAQPPRTGQEFLEEANSLISALNQENECPALFDLSSNVLELVGEFAQAAVRGDVDPDQTGGGTPPAEVSNAWIIMYRRLADGGCISEDAREALRGINPVDDIRERRTQNVEEDIGTARFLLAVEEGTEEGQSVTCARVEGGQEIRKNLLEAASRGSIEAATIGEHRGGQVLCAVLTKEMGGG